MASLRSPDAMFGGAIGGMANFIEQHARPSRAELRKELKEMRSTKSVTNAAQEELDAKVAAWPPVRKTLYTLISSLTFDLSLAALICFNMVLVWVETDQTVNGQKGPVWVIGCNVFLLIVYVLELAVRVFVWRGEFIQDYRNVMDTAIISLDVLFGILSAISSDLPSVAYLRMFRLVRLGRTFHLLVYFPELHMLVQGLFGAVKAICWGTLLLTIVLAVCGILAVQLIHPLNRDIAATGVYDGVCSRCPRAFESTSQAMLTFLQTIVAGDSWGTYVLPIVEKSPITVWFFVGVLVAVNLAILNLILAVIVDNAQEARNEDVKTLIKQKKKQFENVSEKLVEVCKSMDEDASGCLTFQELVEGFEKNPEFFDMMSLMDIKKEDMQVVFSIMDGDRSGSVSYKEFVDELFKMKSHDAHTMLVFIKFYVTEIRRKITEELGLLRTDVLQAIDHISFNAGPPQKAFVDIPAPPYMTVTDREDTDVFQSEPPKNTDHEIIKLRQVNEELVTVMRDVAAKSETHTGILVSLCTQLPKGLRLPPDDKQSQQDNFSSSKLRPLSLDSRESPQTPISSDPGLGMFGRHCCTASRGERVTIPAPQKARFDSAGPE